MTPEDAGALLTILALLGMCARHPAGSGALYTCGPVFAQAPPDADPTVRPLEEIRTRELWAAVRDAQDDAGLIATGALAALLDAAPRRVDRVDVALRLAALAVRDLLVLGPDRGGDRPWAMTRRGLEQALGLARRGLADDEVWAVLAIATPPGADDINLVNAARRLGANLEGWADRQIRHGRLVDAGGGLQLTDAGREAIIAATRRSPAP